jgi:hypothetical protein
MKVTNLFTAAVFSALLMSFSLPGAIKHIPLPGTAIYPDRSLVWKSESVDLGNIPQNKPVKVSFEFTNSSDAPVIISNVATSCGCTGATYSKEAIRPEESSLISVTYNAALLGVFNKTITVTLANNETKQLVIKGTVVNP